MAIRFTIPRIILFFKLGRIVQHCRNVRHQVKQKGLTKHTDERNKFTLFCLINLVIQGFVIWFSDWSRWFKFGELPQISNGTHFLLSYMDHIFHYRHYILAWDKGSLIDPQCRGQITDSRQHLVNSWIIYSSSGLFSLSNSSCENKVHVKNRLLQDHFLRAWQTAITVVGNNSILTLSYAPLSSHLLIWKTGTVTPTVTRFIFLKART